MTDEERQRLTDFIAEQSAKNSVEIEKLLNRDSVAAGQSSETAIARRKLDRDMNRLERVLKRIVEPNDRELERKHEEGKRWQQFEEHWQEFAEQSRKRWAEISAFRAASDQKLKALIDDVRNGRAKRES